MHEFFSAAAVLDEAEDAQQLVAHATYGTRSQPPDGHLARPRLPVPATSKAYRDHLETHVVCGTLRSPYVAAAGGAERRPLGRVTGALAVTPRRS